MNSKLVSLFCCLIMLVSFSGCTKVTQLVKDNQPTKAELLAEINEEHQRWEAAPAADPTPYLRHYDDPADAQKYFDYVTDTYSEYDAAKELSLEEAEEDVNYLFDAFYYDFAFYDYFGGHTVFDQAKAEILQELQAKDNLTCKDLQEVLVKHLTFIKDGHFNINHNFPAEKEIPFFFRQVMFVKTDSGYQDSNGKTVVSVDGHPDLDALFKRSISKEGYLVYYPVLLKKAKFDGQACVRRAIDRALCRWQYGCIDGRHLEPVLQRSPQRAEYRSSPDRWNPGVPVQQL